jgi:hypothetical protein
MIRLRADLSRPILAILHIARRVAPTSREHLGSGLIDHSQKMTVAAMQIAEK